MRAWKVSIPAGRWMGGYVHTFTTKKKALAFIDSWNTVEVNSGNKSVMFYRSSPTAYEPVKEAHEWPLVARAIAEKAAAEKRAADKIADHIDGYDRDDLGESPDY